MAATVGLPVFLRVGDSEEIRIGTITADCTADMQLPPADLLRAAVGEMVKLLNEQQPDRADGP